MTCHFCGRPDRTYDSIMRGLRIPNKDISKKIFEIFRNWTIEDSLTHITEELYEIIDCKLTLYLNKKNEDSKKELIGECDISWESKDPEFCIPTIDLNTDIVKSSVKIRNDNYIEYFEVKFDEKGETEENILGKIVYIESGDEKHPEIYFEDLEHNKTPLSACEHSEFLERANEQIRKVSMTIEEWKQKLNNRQK